MHMACCPTLRTSLPHSSFELNVWDGCVCAPRRTPGNNAIHAARSVPAKARRALPCGIGPGKQLRTMLTGIFAGRVKFGFSRNVVSVQLSRVLCMEGHACI